MSRIFVDRISPYQSGSITIDGFDVDTTALNNFTASQEALNTTLATTGSNTFQGNQTINGSAVQNFTAPGTNEEVAFVNVTGAQVSGKSYDRVFYGIGDFPSFGTQYQDFFAIEYYNGLGYNFGSEISINGKGVNISTTASGSGQGSNIVVIDNYDGTSQVNINSGNKIAINGKAELSNVLQLAPQDPLPAGGTGQLAVSGSDLYYHNGSSWTQIN